MYETFNFYLSNFNIVDDYPDEYLSIMLKYQEIIATSEVNETDITLLLLIN